jgi:hypothetical protein
MKDKFFLFRSDKPQKKFVMLMPTYGHTHRFGATGYRDFTLMSNESSIFYEPDKIKREKVRQRYIKRHLAEPKGVHTPSSMSDLILWTKPTVKKGIKKFEEEFNVKIIFKDTKLTYKMKKEIMG